MSAALYALRVRNAAGWSTVLWFPADDFNAYEHVLLAAPLIARAAGAGACLELRSADADASLIAHWCEREGWRSTDEAQRFT